ncbi:sensor histidine kinase [Hydrogenophaga sp.]|uniref:sensor histidine kinase n=1 Tax=Hydrogenophaga sp. TaxID=1904254 RepID=UPI00351D6661
MEEILVHWEDFARTMVPPSETMSAADLRDHAKEILVSIAAEMETAQSELQRETKSKTPVGRHEDSTSASLHGRLRQNVGFDLPQMGAEYRALRAVVLRLWVAKVDVTGTTVLEDVMRFNEGIDQSLAQAMVTYSAAVANSRDTFLAVLGHDLRSPLGALNSCFALLSLSEGDSKKKRALAIAGSSITAITLLISDLLEYTRSRLGKGIEVLPQPGDLAHLCREVLEEVRMMYPNRLIETQIPVQARAVLDMPRMRQVVTNLLGNAIQHGDPGQAVRLVLEQAAKAFKLVVSNHGTPIAEDAMQVIFNPLVQIEKTTTESHQRPATSLGLGLYIAREIVTKHGGTIRVTSTAEEGTAFTVHLPFAVATV